LGQVAIPVVGDDFRSYSASIKLALTVGLIVGAARVRVIGLALTTGSFPFARSTAFPCSVC
jgi:hypothetical protein